MKLIQNELDNVRTRIKNFNCETEQLKTVLSDFLSQDSKFIRTMTSVLFTKACGEELTEEHYNILTATELIHNASLIHDDAIDNGSIRRGVSSLNRQYGNKFSIIAGDYLMTLAVSELLKLNNNDVLNIYFDTLSKMCEGESIQYFQKSKVPTLDEYLKKTRYQTAELFKACFVTMQMYTMFPKISEARDFAINYGTAFQIKNDLEDYKLGTDNSSDIKEGIYTAPVILSNSFKDSDLAIEKTLDLIDNYCRRARLSIMSVGNNEYSDYLTELVNKLCN